MHTEKAIDETVIPIHMIAGEGYHLACGATTDRYGVLTMTENFEKVTCHDCQIGWLTYERDQYKEMWEREKEGNGSRRQIIELNQRLDRQRNTIARMDQELNELRARSAETPAVVLTHRHNPFTAIGTLCGSAVKPGDLVRSTGIIADVSCKKCRSLMS